MSSNRQPNKSITSEEKHKTPSSSSSSSSSYNPKSEIKETQTSNNSSSSELKKTKKTPENYPPDYFKQYASYLDKTSALSSMISLSKTCRSLRTLFQPDINKAVTKKLTTHVIRGEYAEVKAMLEKASAIPAMLRTLLTTSRQVETYSFREINGKKQYVKVQGTPLQIALIACDVNTGKDKDGNDKNDGMAEMIIGYLLELSDGKEIMAKQIRDIQPEEKEKMARRKTMFDALHKFVNAIAESKSDDDKALVDARDALWEQICPKDVITTDMHYSLIEDLLVEAFKLYEEKYDDFGDFDSRKNNKAWREIIGGIQRNLSTPDAQAFCQSLYDLVEDGKKLNRSLKFRLNANVAFFPLDSDPRFRLGVDFAAGWRCWPGPMSAASRSCADIFKTYVEQKQQRCNDLRNVQTISQRTIAP